MHVMGTSSNTEKGSAPKPSTHSRPLVMIISPGFVPTDAVPWHPLPRAAEGESSLPVPVAQLRPGVPGALTQPPANPQGRQPLQGRHLVREPLLRLESSHSWLTLSAFVGRRKREAERARTSVQQGKGIRKMFLMCIRLCSHTRGLCPASRHVPA